MTRAATDANLQAEAKNVISLYDLQEIIADRIGDIGAWIRAEVAEARISSGHLYLDLIQKEAPMPTLGKTSFTSASAELARARGVIWRSRMHIVDDFVKETGRTLSKGLTIVFHAVVRYHAIFGLSLDIDAIDSSFTLGEREKERRETLRYLTEKGLLELQKDLELPLLPGRIAVISSETAAGFGDFCKHLSENKYGYTFDINLFPAAMQGEAAPASIARALEDAAEECYDLILVLRGGGSETDLQCYDDRGLCETVCHMPVPVLCAVGHERDHHIIDDAAFVSLKTPTALADFLVALVYDTECQMFNLKDNIVDGLKERCDAEEDVLERKLNGLCRSFRAMAEAPARRIESLRASIAGAARQKASTQMVDRLQGSIAHSLVRRCDALEADIRRTRGNIVFALRSQVDARDALLEQQRLRIEAANPQKILRQGYVLAVDERGNVLKGVSSRRRGESFILRFADGHWDCTVDEVKQQ